jgi:hypothetical protein
LTAEIAKHRAEDAEKGRNRKKKAGWEEARQDEEKSSDEEKKGRLASFLCVLRVFLCDLRGQRLFSVAPVFWGLLCHSWPLPARKMRLACTWDKVLRPFRYNPLHLKSLQTNQIGRVMLEARKAYGLFPSYRTFLQFECIAHS